MTYADLISRKLALIPPAGLPDHHVHVKHLFPHQADLTRWAVRRGRAAIFAETGLGKMRMELVFADAVVRATGADVLILAPLAVAPQIVSEGLAIGVHVTHCREAPDVRRGIELWTNPNDVVLSPFAGIGSEGYVSLEMGRRFIGVELKASYYRQAAQNLLNATKQTQDMFSGLEVA